MKGLWAVLAVILLLGGPAGAQTDTACEVPSYLLFADTKLARVAAAAGDRRELDILVVGTGSSSLPGLNGVSNAYPARLEAALRRRLHGITVNVTADVKSRRSAADMVREFDQIPSVRKPVLVVWQTGTFDAMHGIAPEAFRADLDEGVDKLKAAGADVILMNMQYSPRTESMIALDAYVDGMRVVAREQDVTLFDRLAIMRYWSDMGAFDLYASGKDLKMAQQVHDCLGRALASIVIDAGQLSAFETKASG